MYLVEDKKPRTLELKTKNNITERLRILNIVVNKAIELGFISDLIESDSYFPKEYKYGVLFELQKWVREKYTLHIEISFHEDEDKVMWAQFKIVDLTDFSVIDVEESKHMYLAYENALEMALSIIILGKPHYEYE